MEDNGADCMIVDGWSLPAPELSLLSLLLAAPHPNISMGPELIFRGWTDFSDLFP